MKWKYEKLTIQQIEGLVEFSKSDVWGIIKEYLIYKDKNADSIKNIDIRDGSEFVIIRELSKRLGKRDAYSDIINYVENKNKLYEQEIKKIKAEAQNGSRG